jgi:hypothetical protein
VWGGRATLRSRYSPEDWEEAWLSQRKRGRLDACGSTVVSALKWDTSGGQAHAWTADFCATFRVQFVLQVKAFATQLAPARSPVRAPVT